MNPRVNKRELESWKEFDEKKPGLRIGSTDSKTVFSKNLESIETTKDNILDILQDDISQEQKELLEELVEKK